MPSQRNKPLIVLGIVALVIAAGVAAKLTDDSYEASDARRKAEAMTGGSVARGQIAFARYGCGGCHMLSGLPQAHGSVGPPLEGFAGRGIIAGKLENKPDNLEMWIENPQKVTPGTAMPNLGVTPDDARDLAAFLYTRT
ncbi:MAG TPA: c-type cytochrome [Allosphingosinicella sp.]|jgi:cytochrome c2|nr:c-type cytochrome [Allosphingosinicella sp.]